MKRWGILETLAAMVILFVAYLIVAPAFGSNGVPAVRTKCLSNIKQIGTAMAIYEVDYDNRTPARSWAPELQPYLKSVAVETCPAVAKTKLNHGYALNLAMLDVSSIKLANPATDVAFFETDALGRGVVANLAARNEDRHDGKSCVGYMDTHAKVITKGTKP